MAAALGWGALAASSLVVGAFLAFARRWSPRQVGFVLAFGAGALTYDGLDGVIARRQASGRGRRGRAQGDGAGTALALGAFLDGIPEQAVLGINLAAGQGVSVALLIAIFVSNLPEAIGSADDMRKTGRSRQAILRLWVLVATICTVATVAGYLVADAASADVQAGIDGFAAGALLVMLIDSMIPDARSDAGRPAGLITVLGFALAAGLSSVS